MAYPGATLTAEGWVVPDITGGVVQRSEDGTYLVSGDGNPLPLPQPHPRYWFHGFAPDQSTDDNMFRDIVAGSHGQFGINLSKSAAWANKAKGYISTIDPVGGSTDSVIRIPGNNFDYNGGESLFMMWAGQATPDASEQQCMGSSGATSSGGMAVRCTATGRLAFALYGGGISRYSTTSTDNTAGKPFVASEFHTFGILVNGRDRTQSLWIDGDINVSELVLSSGDPVDTLSSNTWNIGTATPAGGTNGLAMNTLAFAGLKFLPTDALAPIAKFTAVMQAFTRQPRAVVLAGAL